VKSLGEFGGGLIGNAIGNVVAHLAPSTAHFEKTRVRLAAQSFDGPQLQESRKEFPIKILLLV
jgi:hypothetical protein